MINNPGKKKLHAIAAGIHLCDDPGTLTKNPKMVSASCELLHQMIRNWGGGAWSAPGHLSLGPKNKKIVLCKLEPFVESGFFVLLLVKLGIKTDLISFITML